MNVIPYIMRREAVKTADLVLQDQYLWAQQPQQRTCGKKYRLIKDCCRNSDCAHAQDDHLSEMGCPH